MKKTHTAGKRLFCINGQSCDYSIKMDRFIFGMISAAGILRKIEEGVSVEGAF